MNFTAIDDSHIQKSGVSRMQLFIGATRLDNDRKNKFLIERNSILQAPVKSREDSYIKIIADLASALLKDENEKQIHTISAKNLLKTRVRVR